MTGGDTYTVVFKPAAEAALAEAWSDAADRDAVTSSSVELERRLRTDPVGVAEREVEGLFFTALLPLRWTYEVSEEDRLVTVKHVRLVAPPAGANGKATRRTEE